MRKEPSSSSDTDKKHKLDENISTHIFSTSATLVGVCLTVIGLVRISNRLKNVSIIGDDLLALSSIVFLIACFLSYLGLRTRGSRQLRENLERIADVWFLVGLCMLAVICILIAYELV